MNKALSYRNLPISWRVVILNKDITQYLDEDNGISNINNSLDYPKLLKFRIGEATLKLNDPEGYFNPNNLNNFYLDNNGNQTGFRADVEIFAGVYFNGDLMERCVFVGNILRVNHNPDQDVRETTIIVSDNSSALKESTIKDFGIEQTLLLDGIETSISGEYQFPKPLSPVSEGSVEATFGGDDLEEVDSISIDGVPDPYKFELTDTALLTEGGKLDGASGGPLVVSLKAPHRNKRVFNIVTKILEYYQINNSNVDIRDNISDHQHFSSNGRVGYDFNESGGIWRWNGLVTDFVCHSDASSVYFLYSGLGITRAPRIVEYSYATDEYTVLYTHNATAELWSIATDDFANFYILGTKGRYNNGSPSVGAYDSSESNSQVFIWKYEIDTDTIEEYLSPSDTFRPQLASHFHTGHGGIDQISKTRFGSLPMSKKMIVHEGYLYYIWATNIGFGVARSNAAHSASSMFATNKDSDGYNTCGCAFTIDEDRLYGAFTRISLANTESSLKIVSRGI